MEPTRFEMEWYCHLITTALENNDAVLDVDAPDTHIDHIVLVEEHTDQIENECVYFDLDIAYAEATDDGVKVVLFSEDDWTPIRPEQVDLDEHDSFYHALADLFGGEPKDYQLEESWADEQYTRLCLGYWELYKQDDISEEQLREYTKHGPARFEMLYEPSDSSSFVPLEEL